MAGSKKKPQLVVEDGKPTAVILDIGEYEELLERAEGAADLAVLREMRQQPLEFRPLTEFLGEYSPGV